MATDTAEHGRPEEIKAIPVRHPGRWVAAAIIVFLGVASAIRSRRTPASSGGSSATTSSTPHPHGVVVTIELTVASMAIGIVARRGAGRDAPVAEPARRRRELGVHLALPRHAGARPDPASGTTSRRSIPRFALGIPFGPTSCTSRHALITPFVAGMLALGLNEGAYMAEIVRAGIISVDGGPDPGGAEPRDDPPADHAADRAAAGDARDHPADGQRDDLDAEDDLARQRHRPVAPELLYAAQLIYSVNYR